MRQIKRNSFSRITLYRDLYHPILGLKHVNCKWCGQDAKFMYGWEQDGLRQKPYWQGPFCSVGCYRTYTDQ